MEKLEFKEIISFGFKNGLKNFLPLLGTVILWIITIWIPYLNVGTTIAIATLPAQLSKGKIINPTSIFDAKYRKYMGEYFLVTSLTSMIIGTGLAFFIIPGIVMAYTYMFAQILVVDKGINPAEALTVSNKMTSGNKLNIFLSIFIVCIPLIIPFINIIYLIFIIPIIITMLGYIYGKLEIKDEESTAVVE